MSGQIIHPGDEPEHHCDLPPIPEFEAPTHAELADALDLWYRAREAPVDGELREEISYAAYDVSMRENHSGCDRIADAVLALPAVRRLLADAATVQRVRELLIERRRPDVFMPEDVFLGRLRRALDGG